MHTTVVFVAQNGKMYHRFCGQRLHSQESMKLLVSIKTHALQIVMHVLMFSTMISWASNYIA